MGSWSRLISLVALCVFAQGCNSTDAKSQGPAAETTANNLRHPFHPKTAYQALTPEVSAEINAYGANALNVQCGRESWLAGVTMEW
jgi:hypothetical protein